MEDGKKMSEYDIIDKMEEQLAAKDRENSALRERMRYYLEYIGHDLDAINLIVRKWENTGHVLINGLPSEKIMLELWQAICKAVEGK